MSAYERMIKTNEELIVNHRISDKRKNEIVAELLSEAYIDGLEGPEECPRFYLPRDKKTRYKTLMMQLPKTALLSSNSYELEMIRLLAQLRPMDSVVSQMVQATLQRLRNSCFGNADAGGEECYEASLIVLRFLATTAPKEIEWMRERIEYFESHYGECPRHPGILWYYWLCLSELPMILAKPKIEYYQEILLQRITQSYILKSEQNKELYPMCICIVRNCLARLEKYEFIRDFQPYINAEDGRLHFSLIG